MKKSYASLLVFAGALLAVVSFSTGCGSSKPATPSTPSHSTLPTSTLKLDCNGDNATVNIWPEYVVLQGTLKGKSYSNIRLPKLAGESKYSDGTKTLTTEGDVVTINMGGGEMYSCNVQQKIAGRP